MGRMIILTKNLELRYLAVTYEAEFRVEYGYQQRHTERHTKGKGNDSTAKGCLQGVSSGNLGNPQSGRSYHYGVPLLRPPVMSTPS